MNTFKLIDPTHVEENIFQLIAKDWMLITAGNMKSYNMMTASWGGMGHLWNKQIAICFIRPQRYTYEFVEKNDFFTLSFFDNKFRKILNYLGTESGKNVNKMKVDGLTPITSKNNSIYFEEARLVMECRKLYFDDIKPSNFLNETIDILYPIKDYHRMYFGEITKCLMKE
jgi:flavin reductase (DIM6/NTAB) family NADH-FMN oxidoreductase RutF